MLLRLRSEDFDPDDRVFPGEGGGAMDGSALYRRYKLAQAQGEIRRLRFHEYADVRVMPMSVRRGCSERFRSSGCRHNQSASRNARSASGGW